MCKGPSTDPIPSRVNQQDEANCNLNSSAVVIVTRWGRLYLATATVNPSLANLLATAAPGSGFVTRVFLLETRRNSFVSTIRICASLCPFWDSLCSPILPVHLCPWDQCWGLVLTKRRFETMLFCTMYDIGSVTPPTCSGHVFPTRQTDSQRQTKSCLGIYCCLKLILNEVFFKIQHWSYLSPAPRQLQVPPLEQPSYITSSLWNGFLCLFK